MFRDHSTRLATLWRALLCTALLCALSGTAAAADSARYGLGSPANAPSIAAQDIAIGPRGEELPIGSGTAPQGKEIYAAKCAFCHGATGSEGPDPVLVGGQGTLTSAEPRLTIGSYWSHPTTVFDYIYRAMPFTAPGSLSADEVYALTAFLLAANGVIDEAARIDRDTLPNPTFSTEGVEQG